MRLNRLVYVGAMAALMCSGCPSSENSISVEGKTRTYTLHVPAQLAADEPAPLVIALNFLWGTTEDTRRMCGFDQMADREGFFVVYPDAIHLRWNAGMPLLDIGASDDVAFISALIDLLVDQYDIDPSRVYATGGSDGAMMAHYLGCRIPGKLAAIAPVFGTMAAGATFQCSEGIPMPVLCIHGTKDPILPWDGGTFVDLGELTDMLSAPATAEFWAAHNGCVGEPETTALPDIDPSDGATAIRHVYKGATAASDVVFYEIVNGGHTWPGTSYKFPRCAAGPTCMDIDASEIIWAFFKEHRRNEE